MGPRITKEESRALENKLKQWVQESDNIVFFGGAGVSTESGIPDFRSVDGLYNEKYKYPPERILSHTFYEMKTEEFYEFYRDKMLYLDAQPNSVHKKLAELERQGKLKAIITQNIDGLHQAAGSQCVLELHGSVHRNYCQECGKMFNARYIRKSTGIPKCDACGGTIKPDVVLYEENLDHALMDKAVFYISQAEMLIIGGTSLAVYPAAGLINYYHGDKLVLINKSSTPRDRYANLVIQTGLGEVFYRL
ncbi:MAG: NAD-dependent protein deacylase [Lachnospiraceae bacterium]|nr:NAD-dependent protein deacylase [Lachnospiraceae bacterium]